MDAGVAALIGAGVGAIGGVSAQVISAVLAERRERRKIESDRQSSVDARFFPLRFDKYGALIAALRQGEETLYNAYSKRDVSVVVAYEDDEFPKIQRLQADLTLLSPTISDVVGQAVTGLGSLILDTWSFCAPEENPNNNSDNDMRREFFASYRDAQERTAYVEERMRRELGLPASTNT